MSLLDRIRSVFTRIVPKRSCITFSFSCGSDSYQDFWKNVILRIKQNGYSRIMRKNTTELFYQISDLNHDEITVIELIPKEMSGQINIEEEIGSMNTDFLEHGVDAESTARRKVALVFVSDSDLDALQEQLLDSTYVDPGSSPPQQCFDLCIAACVNPTSGEVLFSPKPEILKKEWRELVNTVVYIITDQAPD